MFGRENKNNKLLNAFKRLANEMCSIYTEALDTPTDMPMLLKWLPNYKMHQKETSKYNEIFHAMRALLGNPKSKTDYQTLVSINTEWSKNKPYFKNSGWMMGISSFAGLIAFLSCAALFLSIIFHPPILLIILITVLVVSAVIGLLALSAAMFMNWANSLQQTTPRSELENAIEEAKEFQQLLPVNPNNRNAVAPQNNNVINQAAYQHQPLLFPNPPADDSENDDAQETPTPGQEEETPRKNSNAY